MSKKAPGWNSREAAYHALLSALSRPIYLMETLEAWQGRDHPSSLDFRFAQEMAFGTMRRLLTLDHFARQLTSRGQLRLKLKEKVLLFSALYQFFYMDKVPLYALINESMILAKRYAHPRFASFLHALLQKLPSTPCSLPDDSSVLSLSIRYSVPPFFIEELLADYGLEIALLILQESHQPPIPMARLRPHAFSTPLKDLQWVLESPVKMGIPKNAQHLKSLAQSPDVYIQNGTPAVLLARCCLQRASPPKTILDLCASPGGKLIGAHDFFPSASLFANDVSEGKLAILKQNLEKTGVSATLTCGDGCRFTSITSFDVVIVDAPCSNSGVLNKRPEARWRLSKETLQAHQELQMALVERALSLIGTSGEVWYMTCSILKKENEAILSKLKERGYSIAWQETVLPNDGWDGGFAVVIKNNR